MNAKKTTTRGNQARTINWDEIHRRLGAIRTAVDQGRVPAPEEKNRILKARARALAQKAEEQRGPEEYLEVIEFALAYENYGIETVYVREVHPLTDLTPLPCTPPFVLGIINVRGEILSVIDIKKFFGLPEKGLTDLNKVIVVHSDGMTFGILADLIVGVRNVSISELQPSLPTLTGIREEYLRGVTGDQVVILDAGKLLSDRKIVVQEQVEA